MDNEKLRVDGSKNKEPIQETYLDAETERIEISDKKITINVPSWYSEYMRRNALERARTSRRVIDITRQQAKKTREAYMEFPKGAIIDLTITEMGEAHARWYAQRHRN